MYERVMKLLDIDEKSVLNHLVVQKDIMILSKIFGMNWVNKREKNHNVVVDSNVNE